VTNKAPLPTEPIVAPTGRIAGDLPCIACGYNLRALAEAGRCPECGEPVKRSTTYHLRPSPAWLKRLEEGVNLLTTGIPVIGIGAGLLGLGGFLLGSFSGVSAAAPLLVFAVLLVSAISVVKITIADPTPLVRRREGLSWRRVTRLCLLLSPVILAPPIIQTTSWTALVLACLPAAILPPAFFCHMAALMARVLRPDLARTARRLALALALTELAFVVWYGSMHFVPRGFALPGLIPLSVWGAGVGVILVLGFIFMIRASRALSVAQHRAEHWLSGAGQASTTDRAPSQETTTPGS
jgi:hypothetical protein